MTLTHNVEMGNQSQQFDILKLYPHLYSLDLKSNNGICLNLNGKKQSWQINKTQYLKALTVLTLILML